MNFVHIVGRLGRDPETRFTADGLKVTTMVVATTARKGGNEETIWWRVTLWGDRWDKMITYLKKGKPVMVGGEMRKPEVYTDKNGQSQISSIELTGDYVKFVPFGKPEGAEQGAGATQQAGQPQAGTTETGSAQDVAGAPDEEPLPF